jgi:hypothetical protein
MVIGLNPSGSVMVDVADESFEKAAGRAAERAARAVVRSLERRRHADEYQVKRRNV